jgi:hypothetical protein
VVTRASFGGSVVTRASFGSMVARVVTRAGSGNV